MQFIRYKSRNDTHKSIIFILFVVFILIIVYNEYIKDQSDPINVTELIITYKNYKIVDKSDSNGYSLVLINPYILDNIRPLTKIRVTSTVYYHFYVGDTIGNTKRRVFGY